MHIRGHIDRRYQVPIGFALGMVAFAALFVALVLSAFHEPTPHGMPVGIVSSPAVSERLQGTLDTSDPGGITLRTYRNTAAASAAIMERHVDGAVIITHRGMELMTAEAGGTAPAELLTGVFDAVAAHSGANLRVVDVAPPLSRDSQGLAPFFIILAVLFPSLATGVVSAHVLRRRHPAWRVGAPIVVAASIGLVVSAIADGITGFGDYVAVAGIIALFSLAISAPTAALGRIKLPLIGCSIFVFIVLGLPVSGGPAGLAPFGPAFLRWLDSVLPLGVAATVVRNTVYFHGNDISADLWVLAAWAAAGVGALASLGSRGLNKASKVVGTGYPT